MNILVRDYSEINITPKDDNPIQDKNKYMVDDNFESLSVNSIVVENNFIDYNINHNEELKIEKLLPEITPIGVVFETYILGENRRLDKLFFIDQHAAHERVMYEKYRSEFEKELVNIQQLISPEIIELTNSEFNDFTQNIELFRNLGFELEEFGSNSVAIRGVPFLFGKPNARNLFLDLIDNLGKNLKSPYDTRLDKLMKLACTSAIKSGDKLSNIEIKSLLNDLSQCENPYSCPHGRPTIIEISKKDIEKQFLRII